MEPSDQLYQPVKELLARYEATSSRIMVREVDPSGNLAEAQALVDRHAIDSVNMILFEGGDNRRLVDSADLAEYDYSGLQFGQGPRMTGFKGEQSFTSALSSSAAARVRRCSSRRATESFNWEILAGRSHGPRGAAPEGQLRGRGLGIAR